MRVIQSYGPVNATSNSGALANHNEQKPGQTTLDQPIEKTKKFERALFDNALTKEITYGGIEIIIPYCEATSITPMPDKKT